MRIPVGVMCTVSPSAKQGDGFPGAWPTLRLTRPHLSCSWPCRSHRMPGPEVFAALSTGLFPRLLEPSQTLLPVLSPPSTPSGHARTHGNCGRLGAITGALVMPVPGHFCIVPLVCCWHRATSTFCFLLNPPETRDFKPERWKPGPPIRASVLSLSLFLPPKALYFLLPTMETFFTSIA